LIESADNVFRYLQLQFVDIGVVDVFQRIPYEGLIDTLAEHGTGLKYKPHLWLSEELLC